MNKKSLFAALIVTALIFSAGMLIQTPHRSSSRPVSATANSLPSGDYYLNFTESHLPAGVKWHVVLNGTAGSATNTTVTKGTTVYGNISFTLKGGYSYYYNVTNGTDAWQFYKTNSSVDLTTSTSLTEAANETYTVSFKENGLPSGTAWKVYLNTTSTATQTSTPDLVSSGTGVYDNFTAINATYSFAVPRLLSRTWDASPASGPLIVAGAAVSQAVTFTEVTYAVSLHETGLPAGTNWTVTTGGFKPFTDAGSNTYSAYCPITITNTQSIPTSSPFDQLLNLTLPNGANANWSNVAFTIAGHQELYSWVQQRGTHSLIWIQLPNGIPAGGSVTVQAWVGASTVKWDSFRGEAPTLSATYGTHDTGAKVFPFYDNFAGTTLNTSKWQTIVSGGTISQDNGVTISIGNSASAVLFSKNTLIYPLILETNSTLTVTQGSPAVGQVGAALSSSNGGTALGYALDSSYVFGGGGTGSPSQLALISSSGAGTSLGTGVSNGNPAIRGLQWQATGFEYTLLSNAYTTDSGTDSSLAIADYYFYAGGMGSGGGGAGHMLIQWALALTPAPNNVMPGFSVGTESQVPVPLYSKTAYINTSEPNGTYAWHAGYVPGYNAGTTASISFTVSGSPASESVVFTEWKYTLSFQEIGLPVNTTWAVTISGLQHSSSSGYVNFTEPNGTYNYSITHINGFTTPAYSGTVTINGVNSTVFIMWSKQFYITFTEHNLTTGEQWSVTLNGTKRNTTTTTATFLVGNGTYTYTIGSLSDFYLPSYSGSVRVNGSNVNVNVYWLSYPVAKWTPYNSTLPYDTAIVFNASASSSASSTITNWSWTFKNGLSIQSEYGEVVSMYFTHTGNYTVTLTVTNSYGKQSTASGFANVISPTPTSSIRLSVSYTTLPNGNLHFTVIVSSSLSISAFSVKVDSTYVNATLICQSEESVEIPDNGIEREVVVKQDDYDAEHEEEEYHCAECCAHRPVSVQTTSSPCVCRCSFLPSLHTGQLRVCQ